ncbi:atos homolog protein A [Patella vulgata]|uniref:atos homolog protein A n=1 Tax=Patella vulgata TaxID=6465 RepID=UPI00217F57F0|nr:atos homolog protein A [Patella vulgata]
MKPERDVEFCDMDVVVRDPREVLEEVGLLILEARTPDLSVKGRREGSHCPTVQGGGSHLCLQEKEECSRAAEVKRRMHCAWRNSVPTYIDVFLLPGCKHGQKEASTVEGLAGSMKEKSILLERWYIEIMKKRHEKIEGSVSSSFLVQAVRSYLHFSQLSSWLLSTGGTLSLNIVYRLSVPGEGVTEQFHENPDFHTFPKAEFTKVGLSITVEALPRQPEIPALICSKETSQICPSSKKGRISPKNKTESKMRENIIDTEQHIPPNYLDKVYYQYEPSTKARHHSKTEPKKDSKINEPGCGCPQERSPRQSTHRHSTVASSKRSATPTGKASTSTQNLLTGQGCSTSHQASVQYPDQRKSPSRQIFRDNLLPLKQEYPSSSLQVTDNSSKRLHSPKILLATATGSSVDCTKKKRLDLSEAEACVSWEKDYLSAKIKPMDINEYLTNLQNYSFSYSSLSDNLSDEYTPRCKFYIGENCDLKTTACASTEEVETPLKRQRERKRSFEEVPRKLFAQSLSDSSEIQPAIRTDQSENGFCHTCDKEHSLSENGFLICNDKKKKKSENGFYLRYPKESSNGHTSETEVENGVQKVTDLLDKFSVEDQFNIFKTGSNDVFFDSGLHLEDDNCDKDLYNTSQLNLSSSLQDSCLEKSQLLSEAPLFPTTSKCDSDTAYTKHCHNSPKRAFSVPDYSSDNEVAVTNGFSLCKTDDKQDKNPLNKVLNSPTIEDIMSFRRHLTKSASMMFNQRTGLPSQSSPAPTKRKSGRFDYDSTLTNARAIKYALSCSKLALASEGDGDQILEESGRVLSTSAPASTNCLLGNFEESILNGRIEPIGAVDGFTAEIGASGSFCPKHLVLPVSAYFFKLSDDNAPSPYLGHINFESLGKRGYHIPKKGTVQVTLFNPNKTVVKMFVVMYDMTDMPPRSQTFIRQRTLYMPVESNSSEPSYLRYLIHLRFASTKSSKVYLHTDLRLIFARDKFEFDNKVAQYELRSFTEGPTKPKYSPKR